MAKAMLRIVASAVALMAATVSASVDWSPVDQAIERAIAGKVFPGAAVVVGTAEGILYMNAFGNFTYGNDTPIGHDHPAVTLTTRYDMASLTKVSSTTSAVALLYQEGYLGLDELVASERLLGSEFAQNGKGVITIENLLLHNAGFPPDPVPGYSTPEFGCPATASEHPEEAFSCSDKILESVKAQTLENVPGDVYVYSDLSMITMHMAIGRLIEAEGLVEGGAKALLPECQDMIAAGKAGPGVLHTCYYEAFVRQRVFGELCMEDSGFLPAKQDWAVAAPTWVDPTYRHETMQGQVSDENSYANGGVSGHAGLFSTALDMAKLGVQLMAGRAAVPPKNIRPSALPVPTGCSMPSAQGWLNETTMELFTTVHNLTQSSRALGWDTNDYTMNTYRGCHNLSPKTFTHLGYTGTEICCDPVLGIFTVLLDNRCYPAKTGNLGTPIQTARQNFNDAAKQVVESATRWEAPY